MALAAQAGFANDRGGDGISLSPSGIAIMVGMFLVVIAAVAIPTALRVRVRNARMRRIDREAEIGQIDDERWNPRRLKGPVRSAFLPVQDAWSRGSIDKVGTYLSDDQVARLSDALAARSGAQRANHVEDVVLDEVTILRVEGGLDSEPARFVAYVGWRARDWTEDVETGRVLEGKRSRLRRFGQLWTFARDAERGWLVQDIEDASAETATLALPAVALGAT